MASAAPPFIHSCTRPHTAPHTFLWKSLKISPNFCRCELSPQSLSPPIANNNAVRQLPTNYTPVELYHAVKKERDSVKSFKILKEVIAQLGYTPHPSLCELLIHRLGYAGHLEQMRDVLSLMSEPTEEAFCSIIMGYGKAHMVEQALGVLNEMEVNRFPPTTKIYNMLLNFLAYENKFTMVESLYSQMKSAGIQPDVKTFNTLIKAQFRAGNMASALSLLKQMSSDFGLVPDEVTYTTLMAGFVQRDRLEEALDLLKEMESNGFTPTVKNYTTLIHGFCNKGKMDEAAKLLEELCGKGLYPNEVTFSAIINGFCKQGWVDEAAKLLKEICGNGLNPNIATLNSIINVFCKEGKMTEAVELMTRMLGCGLYPDTVTFTAVINGFCNQGRIEDAFKLLEEMRGHGISPDTVTYTVIIRGLCTSKELDKAIDLLEKMERERIKPNVVTYNTVILGFCIVGKSEEARKLLDEMAVKGCAPDIFTYNTVLRAMHTEGRAEAAIDLFNEFTSKGHIPDDYTYRIIYFFCKDGDLSAALKLIYCMLARNCIPDSRAYNVLVKRLLRAGMSLQATQLMREMDAKGSCPGSFNSARIGRVNDHRILKSDSQETSDSSAISGLV